VCAAETQASGVIEMILDHRLNSQGLHELLVEWQGEKPSWEPFQSLFRDVPKLITDYFSQGGSRPSIKEVLEIEQRANRPAGRGRGDWQPRGRGYEVGGNRGRGSWEGQGRGFRGGRYGIVMNAETGEEEFNPRKFRRECKSRAADRKIQMWETQQQGDRPTHPWLVQSQALLQSSQKND